MLKIITIDTVRECLAKTTIKTFFTDFINYLEQDFAKWQEFDKRPRPAFHSKDGVVELMPVSNQDYFSCKTVNGHPNNPKQNKMCVIATGLLAQMETGYPILFSEMTLLTALRTGATSALASKYLARKNSSKIAIIGCGSQAEFQILAHSVLFDITTVKCFDTDPLTMAKFANNLQDQNFQIILCNSAQECVQGVDIIITVTADKLMAQVLQNNWIEEGVHINGLGGDCPDKTELDPLILEKAKIVIELWEQTKEEGEIQALVKKYGELEAKNRVYGELWEIITSTKLGRTDEKEITLFDGVGFGLEDYSILRFMDKLTDDLGIFEKMNIIPDIEDPKNLFGLLK
jgi:ornithine cyclodeaminase